MLYECCAPVTLNFTSPSTEDRGLIHIGSNTAMFDVYVGWAVIGITNT